MSNLARIILTISVFLMGWLLSWLILLFLPLGRHDWIGSLLAFGAATLLARLAWLRSVTAPGSALGMAFLPRFLRTDGLRAGG